MIRSDLRRSRNAPRSHCGSATCARGLAAPDRSGVPPFCAFGLLGCCCRFRSSCVGTTLRPANEAAQARFKTNAVYASVKSNARFRKRGQRPRCHRSRCRTALSGPRSAGPHSHDAPMLTYGSRTRTSQFTHGLASTRTRARTRAHTRSRKLTHATARRSQRRSPMRICIVHSSPRTIIPRVRAR